MSRLVAVSGAIASGKSEFTRELATRWSCPRASFGALVTREANGRQLPTDRDTLQRLGGELIAELGWQEFCARTIALAGASWETDKLIIDGIRHHEAIDTLRLGFSPMSVLLVHVACRPEIRLKRQFARGATPEEIDRWSHDPTEQALGSLEAIADLVVRGDRPPSEAIAAVEAAMP